MVRGEREREELERVKDGEKKEKEKKDRRGERGRENGWERGGTVWVCWVRQRAGMSEREMER
jgi:hypothetical protein